MPKFKSRIAVILAMGAAILIQGCGGSGGDAAGNRVDTMNPGSAVLAAPNSELRVHPVYGLAGSTVAISGAGFADACGATLFLEKPGGDRLARASIKDGVFKVQAALPEALNSGELVIVGELLKSDGQECLQPTGNTFETKFDVIGTMPIIELAVRDGRPGSDVEINGRGFCGAAECSAVTLLIDGQVAVSGVEVAEDGTFASGAMVPAIDAAGLVAVVAVQTAADGSELRGFGELFVTVRPNEEPPVVQ